MPYVMLFAKRGRYGKGPSLPTSGLLANWDMFGGSGQSVSDKSSNGNPLQLGATSGSDATDPTFGAKGLTFTGTQYCVTTNFQPVGVPFSILVVFQTALQAGLQALVGGQTAANLLLLYVTPAGTLSLAKHNVADIGGTNSALTGAPFFGAVSYDGTAWKAYRSGVLDNSGSNALALGGNAPLMVGASQVTSYFFNGTIYQVLYYSRILSNAEVSNAYRNLKAVWAGRGVAI